MSQDNIQADTQQSETEFASLEEAVFGGNVESDNIASAFTSGNEVTNETAPVIGQPEVVNQENESIPPQPNNDDTRFEYWQSQADKYKNEVDELKNSQPAQVNQPAPVEPVNQEADDFPLAPEKPQQPRTFNREEAYSDPSSESARYLDELDDWRDNDRQYNNLKSQYQTALIEDKFNKMEQGRVNEAKRVQAQQEKSNQEAEVKSHVMGHYGMNDSQAVDFMTKMSDPSSITIDNLVQLYRFQNSGAASQSAPPSSPSDTFTQTRNAQQVPSPMGVLPTGQNNSENVNFEDKMMDTMIGNFNSKNPWK